MRLARVGVTRSVAALPIAGEYEQSGMRATSDLLGLSDVTGGRDAGLVAEALQRVAVN